MRKYTALKSALVTGAAIASALGLAVTNASAATTWTVSGMPASGAATLTSTNTVLTDTATGTQLKCTTATAGINLTNGTGKSGTPLGTVTAASWTGCSGPLGITFTVTPQNLAWAKNSVSYSNGVTTGTLSGVEAHISGVGCTADFRGASATSPATVDVKYTNSTHTLTVLGTGNLHAFNVSGTCLGLLNSGDAATYKGDYVAPAAVVITSP